MTSRSLRDERIERLQSHVYTNNSFNVYVTQVKSREENEFLNTITLYLFIIRVSLSPHISLLNRFFVMLLICSELICSFVFFNVADLRRRFANLRAQVNTHELDHKRATACLLSLRFTDFSRRIRMMIEIAERRETSTNRDRNDWVAVKILSKNRVNLGRSVL